MDSPIRRSRAAGFTLLELLVVVAILGVLATVVSQSLLDEPAKAEVTAAKSDLSSFYQAMNRYRIDHSNRYPTEWDDLLGTAEGGDAYVDAEEIPVDPWGNEYRFERDGNRVLIASDGPDRDPDTDDDLTTRNFRRRKRN